MAKLTNDCDICCGRGTIRLPVYRPPSVREDVVSATDTIPADEVARYYPCPECTSVPDHKMHIAISQESVSDDALALNDDIRGIVRKDAARHLVDYLLRHDLVRFREAPNPAFPRTTQITAQLVVVTPDRITTLEQRVLEATLHAVDRAANRAIDKIHNWGSHDGRRSITKEEAARFIRQAVSEEMLGVYNG